MQINIFSPSTRFERNPRLIVLSILNYNNSVNFTFFYYLILKAVLNERKKEIEIFLILVLNFTEKLLP